MKKDLIFYAALYSMLIFFISCTNASPKQKNPPPFPGFKTDFSKSSMDFSDVISGGPPKDGIPSIDNPEFTEITEAEKWLDPREPVILVRYTDGALKAETKIYPVQILMWHEIVNDRIIDAPIAVTYCPLCNSGIVFLSQAQGRELDFGVSGLLRYSNMIMYDRQTETMWQQATGEAVAGDMTGTRLEIIPSLTLSFEDAGREYPDALVLSRDTGMIRPYGTNPYEGYDSLTQPFLYRGPDVDDTYGMLEQVIAVISGNKTQAVPYSKLRTEGVVQFELEGKNIAVFWKGGTVSALDKSLISEGRDTGSANAFIAEIDGIILEFEKSGNSFRDRPTGSLWNASGRSVEGVLKRRQLETAAAIQHYWFSYSAFSTEYEHRISK